jgi:hypothetical protein
MDSLRSSTVPLRRLAERLLSTLALAGIIAAPASGKNPELFSSVAFHVWTGDDDLRGNSEALVDLTFPNGSTKRCFLKLNGDPSWDNNTQHDGHQCILPAARTFKQLRRTKMRLAYFSGLGDFQTQDNWNVNRVRVEAQDIHRHHFPCILDVSGNPLVRMTGHLGHFRLDQAPSVC